MATKKRRGRGRTALGNNSFRCLNCGDEYVVNMPASITMMAAIMDAFDKDHAGCKPSAAGRARFEYTNPDEWIKSWDTGESSKTIWHYMMGRSYRSCLPLDPDDFGRCYRLLKAFPEWRSRLPEMAHDMRSWAPMIAAWSDLERLYEEELPTGTAPKLYQAMQEFHR